MGFGSYSSWSRFSEVLGLAYAEEIVRLHWLLRKRSEHRVRCLLGKRSEHRAFAACRGKDQRAGFAACLGNDRSTAFAAATESHATPICGTVSEFDITLLLRMHVDVEWAGADLFCFWLCARTSYSLAPSCVPPNPSRGTPPPICNPAPSCLAGPRLRHNCRRSVADDDDADEGLHYREVEGGYPLDNLSKINNINIDFVNFCAILIYIFYAI